MIQSERKPITDQTQTERVPRLDIEILIGALLLEGVLLSIGLLLLGLVWQWATTGHLGIDYTIRGMNLFQFVLADIHQVASGSLSPGLLVNIGIAVLMLTPYMRVLVSMVYFAIIERNRKYTFFTAFVLSILTYSLFLR
jgi:uncharacterized membrane protein